MTQDSRSRLSDLLRMNRGATYREIQDWVKSHYGFVPKTCWIARCRELNGLPTRRAHNRQGAKRIVPCPPDKRPAIEAAFRAFGMI